MNPEIIKSAIEAVVKGEAALLDVRTDEEWQDGHAISATHFELARLEKGELPEVAKDKKIYTYCRAGGRAGKAAEILKSQGFENVLSLGGLSDWERAGGGVEK